MGKIEPKTVTLRTGQTICIRTPEVGDVNATLDYLEKIFKDDRFFLTSMEEAAEWHTVEKQQERIEKSLADDNKLLVISEIGGQIISMSDVEAGHRKRNRHVGQLGISILPEYRGLGLGTAMMETMIEWTQKHPTIEKLALGVWAQNEPAIGLYRKMGFIEEGHRPKEVKYADGSYDDMVCMYRFVKRTST